MAAGSAMTSRESHEVRQRAMERQARSGCPRWKNEATRPAPRNASDRALPSA